VTLAVVSNAIKLSCRATDFDFRAGISSVNFNALFDDDSADSPQSHSCRITRSGSEATDSKLLMIGKRRALPDQQSYPAARGAYRVSIFARDCQ
jgi:hypothetical protein